MEQQNDQVSFIVKKSFILILVTWIVAKKKKNTKKLEILKK